MEITNSHAINEMASKYHIYHQEAASGIKVPKIIPNGNTNKFIRPPNLNPPRPQIN